MTVYLLYMISPIIVWFFVEAVFHKSVVRSESAKRIYLVICGIIMALMVGLRYYGVGSGDSRFYYYNWEDMATVPLSELWDTIQTTDIEIGYQFAVWVVSHILPNGQWLFVLTGIFFAVSVCTFAFRNCKNVVLAMLVFNCLGLFNFMVQGLRQAVAMCICLWAIEYCKKQKLGKFLLLVAAACLFHASAIIFAPAYFLRRFKVSIGNVVVFSVCVAIAILCLPVAVQIVNIVMNENYKMGTQSESGGIVAVFISLAILVFGFLSQDRDNPNYGLFFFCTLVAGIGMFMRNTVIGIAERASLYYTFGQMVIISNSVTKLRKGNQRLLTNCLVSALCIGVAIYKASYSILIPYTFFWQG